MRAQEKISQAITCIFGLENLVTGFLAGSLAMGSDIDIFVCHREPLTTAQQNQFFELYLDLHKRYDRVPDLDYPGEVMQLDNLYSAMLATKNTEPCKHLQDSHIYDGIVWAGMLSGSKIMMLPYSHEHNVLEGLGADIVRQWVNKLYDRRSTPSLPSDKILKRIITYHG